jgi:hypothetical protein
LKKKQEAKEKLLVSRELVIDTNLNSTDTFSYIGMNDKATPSGFDTRKLNAMKFSKRRTSKKSIKQRGHTRTLSYAANGGKSGNLSRRPSMEMSIADSDSENDGNSDKSLDLLKPNSRKSRLFRSERPQRNKRRNMSLGGTILEPYVENKKMPKQKRLETIQLLELEKLEIERRIMMIKTKKR